MSNYVCSPHVVKFSFYSTSDRNSFCKDHTGLKPKFCEKRTAHVLCTSLDQSLFAIGIKLQETMLNGRETIK